MANTSNILIKNISWLIPMTSEKIIEDIDIRIENNIIKEIGKDLPSNNNEELINGRGKLFLPGFVNTHHHFYQTLTRNIPSLQNVPLFPWLIGHYEIWKNLTPEAIYTSSLVAISELILTGCTTSSDHLYIMKPGFFEQEVKAARETGIRFYPTRGMMSLGKSRGGLPPDELVQSDNEILRDTDEIVNKFHNPEKFSMLRVALAPCSPFSVTPELMKSTVNYAREHKLLCHTHIAETLDEEKFCIEKYGKRPIDYLSSLDWLGPDIWLAHCVHLNTKELNLLKATKTGVAHCPTSNMRLASGVARIPEMLKLKLNVGLGVDGSSSNDTSNMLLELRNCLLVNKLTYGADSISAYDVLKMATIFGARVLGVDDEIGTIEVGKAADIIGWDMRKIGYAGAMHDLMAALIFAGDTQIVDTSIINGVIRVRDGKLLNFNEKKLWAITNRLAKKLVTGSPLTIHLK